MLRAHTHTLCLYIFLQKNVQCLYLICLYYYFWMIKAPIHHSRYITNNIQQLYHFIFLLLYILHYIIIYKSVQTYTHTHPKCIFIAQKTRVFFCILQILKVYLVDSNTIHVGMKQQHTNTENNNNNITGERRKCKLDVLNIIIIHYYSSSLFFGTHTHTQHRLVFLFWWSAYFFLSCLILVPKRTNNTQKKYRLYNLQHSCADPKKKS